MIRRVVLAGSLALLSLRFVRSADASSPARLYLAVDAMRLGLRVQSADDQFRRLPYINEIEGDLVRFLQAQLIAAAAETSVGGMHQQPPLQGYQSLQILDIYCRVDLARGIATPPDSVTGVISVYLHRVVGIGPDAPISEIPAPQPMIFFTAADEQELRAAITRAAEQALTSAVLEPVLRFR